MLAVVADVLEKFIQLLDGAKFRVKLVIEDPRDNAWTQIALQRARVEGAVTIDEETAHIVHIELCSRSVLLPDVHRAWIVTMCSILGQWCF